MGPIVLGVSVFALLGLTGWVKVEMERPRTCRKGHTDHYCLDRWRCRTCAREAEARGLRKLARERKT